MKNLLLVSALFYSFGIFGQTVSDYRYVQFPENFKEFKDNKYGLADLLAQKLKAKNYAIISKMVLGNPCEALTADLTDTSNMFTNKIRVTFQDCQGKTVAAFDGKSFIKDFEAGMQDALTSALKNIPASSPLEKTSQNTVLTNSNTTSAKSPLPVKDETMQQPLKREATKKNTQHSTEQKAEIFTNGFLNLNKINLANGEFLLIQSGDSVPFAHFRPSTKEHVYRVRLADQTETIGYDENGKIVIEMSASDGTIRKETFEK